VGAELPKNAALAIVFVFLTARQDWLVNGRAKSTRYARKPKKKKSGLNEKFGTENNAGKG